MVITSRLYSLFCPCLRNSIEENSIDQKEEDASNLACTLVSDTREWVKKVKLNDEESNYLNTVKITIVFTREIEMIITMNPIQTLSDPESRKPETKTLIFNISLEKENKIEDYSFEDVAEQIEDWILNSKNDRFGISYTVEGEMSLGGRPPFPYFYAQMPFSIIERIPKS